MSRDVHICTHWLRPEAETPQLPSSPHLDLYYEGAIKTRSQTTMLVIRIPINSSMIHTFTNQTVKRGGQKANA
jgi:hypothetical protein